MDKDLKNEEKKEVKVESWLNKESVDIKKDYSLIDYSKYLQLENPIHDSIIMNKKFPLIKSFPQKYSKEQNIPDEINIKILLKDYINKLSLLEKYASENLGLLKPKNKNLSITFFFMKEKMNII